jgi:hypothetical protein
MLQKERIALNQKRLPEIAARIYRRCFILWIIKLVDVQA